MKYDMLTQLAALLESKKVFIRERKPNWLRSLGIALLYLGLSCRQTAEVLSLFDEASHEAARQWYHRAQALLRAPLRRCRPTVAIDETKRKVGRGRWCYTASRRQSIPQTGNCRAGMQLTPTRDGRDAYRFVQRVLRTCTTSPTVVVDRGPWYAWALTRVGLEWERVTFGERNAVEQWFVIFKQRVKRFCRRWPHTARVETAASWCEAFVALHNLRRAYVDIFLLGNKIISRATIIIY